MLRLGKAIFFSGSSVNLKTPALILSAFLRVVGPLRACIGPKDALGLPAPARPAISAISSKVSRGGHFGIF